MPQLQTRQDAAPAAEACAPEPGAFTTAALARELGAQLVGRADLVIETLDMLDRAGPAALCFIGAAQYASAWERSGAAAAIVACGIEVPGHDPETRALLIVPDVEAAMAAALELFASPARPSFPPEGIHPSAIVDPAARIGRAVAIGPNCIVGAETSLGDGVVLVANATIAAGATVGRGTIVHAGAHIADRCMVGMHCIIHAGAVVGADGFGYRPAPDGRGVVRIPHIGIVEIGDHVEIGANSCIDRAKFGATTIGSGTKIDNLVQIAHNCRIGRSCILCGQVGLAGSVVLGDGVVLGGAVGIADHLTLGAGARVAARSGVMNDIPAGETWIGIPAAPAGEATRNYAVFRKLGELMQRVKRCEKMLQR
jgi:UDP-3-O-[3-hydroxymyristoyl] glucosamine N-acyltransferase